MNMCVCVYVCVCVCVYVCVGLHEHIWQYEVTYTVV